MTSPPSPRPPPPPPSPSPPPGSPLPTATPTLALTATESPTASPSPTATPYDGSVMRLKIPRFDVDSAIENIGILSNGYLDTPHDPYNTGWYDIYDKPGFGGNAVFAAHVDYYPRIRGPFYDLAKMDAGDQVIIVMEDGREYVYEVISKVRYPENAIPMGAIIDAPDKPEGDEWITLITCGGRFRPNDGVSGPGQYLDRDVVVARRVS